ncbi:MAG: hypothetical protein AAFZ09_15045, partial [Pseudomonadota bacterium]
MDAHGLVGRAHKQIYVDATRNGPLPIDRGDQHLVNTVKAAIRAYSSQYDPARPGETFYHGINLVALLKLAQRDNIALPAGEQDPDEIARAIIAAIEPMLTAGEGKAWHYATVGEAYVALGNWEAAARWYGAYADQADQFELASSIRQLEELWGIRVGDGEAGQMLAGLKARLLDSGEGAVIELSLGERRALHEAANRDTVLERAAPGGGIGPIFEKVITDNDKRVRAVWFLMGADRCRAIARVNTRWGDAVGTGFLVRGGDFIPEYGDRRLFLTNNHVMSTLPGGYGNKPNQLEIVFDGIGDRTGGRHHFQCKRVVWQSLHTDHDATLVELHPDPGHLPYCDLANR